MEVTFRTKAIILNNYPVGEDDSRAIVYSKDKGKLELVARGTKKIKSKLAGHLLPISLSNLMVVRGRRYDYIGSAVNYNSYSNIKSDLDKLILVGRIINTFSQLIKVGEKDEVVFKLLDRVLNILNSKQKLNIDYELVYNFFTLKLITQLGHKPELYNCVVCKKKIIPHKNKFDLSKGGLICLNCQKNNQNKQVLQISSDCIKILRFTINNDLDKVVKLKISHKLTNETVKTISSFSNYHTDI